MGGIAYIFLTHEDDVADAARYARRFERNGSFTARMLYDADAEVIIDGSHAQSYGDMFEIIPSPAIRRAASVCSTGTGSYLQATIWWDPRPLS